MIGAVLIVLGVILVLAEVVFGLLAVHRAEERTSVMRRLVRGREPARRRRG